jgi:hypothetical protein
MQKEKSYIYFILLKHHHPKDWMKRGRVLVHLKEDNKSLAKDIKNSK